MTLSLAMEDLLPTQQRMRTPAEPMPPPIKEPPAPEENPDGAHLAEPDPGRAGDDLRFPLILPTLARIEKNSTCHNAFCVSRAIQNWFPTAPGFR